MCISSNCASTAGGSGGGGGWFLCECVCVCVSVNRSVCLYTYRNEQNKETENVCFRKRNFDDEVKRIK